MTRQRSLLALVGAPVLGALVGFAAPGCSESGQTPTCPDLSLYNVNAAGEANSPKVAAERAAAVAAGCMTELGDASAELADASAGKP